ncbi:MAG TPA: M48 family metalloprotease [Terriglobia bacterium]|nr:M48 family metalloprotease [Terriglobia bacterium]
MIQNLSRWSIALLVAALMASPGLGQNPDPVPLTEKEVRAQAEKEKKALEQAAREAEKQRKAQEKAEKEAREKAEKEQKALAKAEEERRKHLPKNSDVENIGNRDINKGGPKLLGIVPVPGMMSLEEEIAMGRQLAADVDRQARFIDDPVVAEYVNRIGQNIAHNSDAKVPFTIKVIDSEEINAFALPGGFFYVNSGLLLAADDEAELAGVMAHEIAHVAARHVAKDQAKEKAASFATIPLVLATGPAGFGIRQALGLAIPLGFLKFSRGAEEEADFLGLQYLYKAGYDPESAVSFFEKLQARETAKPGTVSSLWSTHPPTTDRIEKTKKNIDLILDPRDQYVVTTSEFQQVKARLQMLQSVPPPPASAGPDPDQPPSLRRRTPSGGSRSADPNDVDNSGVRPEDREPADNDRPTLRRTR